MGLRNFLEFHCGQTGLIAWLHQPGNFSREAIDEKLLAPGGLFREDAIEILHPGKPFMLSTDLVRLPGVTELVQPARNLFAHFRMARCANPNFGFGHAAGRSEFPRRAWGDSIASNLC
jgi:hypothetical protein